MNPLEQKEQAWRGLPVLGSAGRVCLLTLGLFLVAATSVLAAPQDHAPNGGYGYFDFPTCVRYALVHSEEFLSHRLEIQIRSADLKDAHSEVLPSLSLLSRFYLTRTQGGPYGYQSPFSYQIITDSWDPFLALFKIKSRKILVDIARIAHTEKISKNISRIAKLFLRIHSLDRAVGARNEIVTVRRKLVDFAATKQKQHTTFGLKVDEWSNEVKEDEVKVRDLLSEKEQKLGELKLLLGYHPDFELPLDTRDAVNQVLFGFNGQFVTFGDVQGNNLTLKKLAKEEQLQSNEISGAYVALLPKPVVTFENVENQVDRTNGVNLSIGVNYPIWDGFRRVRNVKRQKMIGEQKKIKRDLESQEFYGKFQHLRDLIQASGAKQSVFSEKGRIAELLEQKYFMCFKSGMPCPDEWDGRGPLRDNGSLSQDPYVNYLKSRINKMEANLEAMRIQEERVNALIDLATIAGGLERYNARIRY